MRAAFIILILAFYPACVSLAQLVQFTDLREKDQKQYEKAKGLYFDGEYDKASALLSEVLESTPGFAEGHLLSGDIESELGNFTRAAFNYEQVIGLTDQYSPLIYLLLANANFQARQYKEATKSYSDYLLKDPADQQNVEIAHERMAISEFRDSAYHHPIIFEPVNLGDSINTAAHEFVNSITADESHLYFTTQRHLGQEAKLYRKEYEEHICFSHKTDNYWSKASEVKLSEGPLGDEGAMCISADGNLIIFTSCFREDTHGSCDLYLTRKTVDGWSSPKNLGEEVNSDNWDAQPSLSPDGSTLYFASNRQGGHGSSDIWRSFLIADDSWGKPENLGPVINSEKSEMAPFIHFDNQTLYFSSDGHPGLGDVDLFLSRRTGDNDWSQPLNLGYPLNDENNDLAIMISASGEQGYISAIRDEGYGGYDIYSFELPENIQPYPATYLEGTVLDASSLQPLNAAVQLFDLVAGKLLMDLKTGQDGKFLVCLPTDREYGLNVTSDGSNFCAVLYVIQVANIRFNVAKELQSLAPHCGITTYETQILPVLTILMEDDDRDVRFYAEKSAGALDEAFAEDAVDPPQDLHDAGVGRVHAEIRDTERDRLEHPEPDVHHADHAGRGDRPERPLGGQCHAVAGPGRDGQDHVTRAEQGQEQPQHDRSCRMRRSRRASCRSRWVRRMLPLASPSHRWSRRAARICISSSRRRRSSPGRPLRPR